MNQIVMPSGNVVPSLEEQDEYRERWRAKFYANRASRTKYVRSTQPFVRKWDISNSGESSFRQNGTEKKVLSEKVQARRDWREKKGFRRDKAKRGGCFCKCNITDARQGHRAWQRNLLAKGTEEAYEELLTYGKNQFTSRWDCC
jgi:hypothetical protein